MSEEKNLVTYDPTRLAGLVGDHLPTSLTLLSVYSLLLEGLTTSKEVREVVSPENNAKQSSVSYAFVCSHPMGEISVELKIMWSPGITWVSTISIDMRCGEASAKLLESHWKDEGTESWYQNNKPAFPGGPVLPRLTYNPRRDTLEDEQTMYLAIMLSAAYVRACQQFSQPF